MSYTMKLYNAISRGPFVRHNYAAINYVCNYSRDIAKLTLPESTTPPDYLLQDLKNATSSQKVLDLVGAHHKIMNTKQLLQGLRSIFTLQKYGNSNMSTTQIIRHPEFEKLCRCLKSQAGMIELSETLEALKVISFVGVPSNSTIVQVLLQLLRHSVNDLSVNHIMFLDFLLRQFKSSPLVDGLLIALPIVFEVNLPVKLDKENIAHLAECLHYASKKSVSSKCLELIINSLIKAIDMRGDIDAKIAYSIVWSICDMESHEFFLPLFKRAMTTLLAEGFDKLNYQEVATTLSKVTSKTSPDNLLYYDDGFYDSCAYYVIDKDMGFEEALYTLLKFIRVGHTNDNLVNYVSRKFKENPGLLVEAPPLLIYSAAAIIAQSEYKPTYWDDMKEVIQSTKCFAKYEKRDIPWLKFAASLFALDINKFDVLEKALDTSYLTYIARNGFPDDYDNFMLLRQVINTYHTDYIHLLPEESITKAMISKVKPVLEYPLEGALQRALGGEKYVNTCIRTRLHHHIDHVIVMRKGGFPVPISQHNKYIEDIEVPTDGYPILILALNDSQYTINSKRLKATSLLTIKTLEARGYHVVPICMEVWQRLPDFERIPFIMQAVRLKIETQIEMSV